MFSLAQLANRLDIDIEAALKKAMDADRAKYPPEETKRMSMDALKKAATRFPLNPY